MKTIFAAVATALLMGSAFAQEGTSPMASPSGSRHMFEFNADSILRGIISFDKSKTRGNSADNDTQLNLNLNYAYSLPTMPRLQLGGRMLYLKDVNSSGDVESYGAQVGAILNHTADLENSAYASLYLGMLWDREYQTGGGNDETRIATAAVGKRFSMEPWGIKHLVYQPEVAFQAKNSTTSGSFDYSQDLQLRFLQFSVFF